MIEGMDDWMKLKENGRGGRLTRLIKPLNLRK
jgi:hypothetical protein